VCFIASPVLQKQITDSKLPSPELRFELKVKSLIVSGELKRRDVWMGNVRIKEKHTFHKLEFFTTIPQQVDG